MTKVRAIAVRIFLAALFPALAAQDAPAASSRREISDRQHIKLVMERLEDGQWKALNPTTVLDRGNSVRFRLQASFAGYLYAYSVSSEGEGEWLYPTSKSVSANRVEGGISYVIPSSSQSYMVEGDPGFDVVYWLISPKPITGERWVPSSEVPPVPKTIIPRCRENDDSALACLDPRAGARPVSAAELTRTGWSAGKGLRPRELRLSPEHEITRIEATGAAGLFLYEFWVAHR